MSVPRPGRILLRTINSLICITICSSSSLLLIDPDLKSLENRVRFEGGGKDLFLYEPISRPNIITWTTVQFLISMAVRGSVVKIQFFSFNVRCVECKSAGDFETNDCIFVMMLQSKFRILHGKMGKTPYTCGSWKFRIFIRYHPGHFLMVLGILSNWIWVSSFLTILN